MGTTDWKQHAACKAPKNLTDEQLREHVNIFFPDESGQKSNRALRFCNACVVRELCLQEHLAEAYGIWGGLRQNDRHRERRRRLRLREAS